MKRIYFDYNVISYLRSGKNADLNRKYEGLFIDHMVVFSPAHLEDIAASAIRGNADKQIVKEEINFLFKIAQRNALRPVTRNQVVLYAETPQDCYNRVIEQYVNNDLAERIEAAVISDANLNPAGSPKEMNNIEPENILDRLIYRELIALELSATGLIDRNEHIPSLNWRFSDLKDRFSVFEAYINLAANLLEKIGYYREKEENSRSRLHDVSHIIYAAYCDIFVSADKKLIKKTQAIYSMLGVPTKLIPLEEFCNS